MTAGTAAIAVAALSREEARSELARLAAAILRHDRAYYIDDTPKISDADYDALRRRNSSIEERWPELVRNDSPSERVGAPPTSGFHKVRHPLPMLSLDNVFTDDELQEFVDRVRKFLNLDPAAEIAIAAEPKIDGLSASLRYDDGELAVGATRGDGRDGEDVTRNLRTIAAVPKRLQGRPPARLEVRGEVYFPIESFHRLNAEQLAAGKRAFVNPRNAAAGSVRQIDPVITAERDLGFFVHSWGETSEALGETVTEARERLAGFGFNVTPGTEVCRDIDAMVRFAEQLYADRSELGFDVDGIVYKVDRLDWQQRLGASTRAPRHSVARKFPAERAKTRILSIDVQVGRTGALTPVASLQPVTVGGVVVGRATLHNRDEIDRLDVREGDLVTVQRAGDVIPQVVDVDLDGRPETSASFEFPEQCPACGRPVEREPDEVVTRCPGGRACEAQAFQQLVHFVSRNAFAIDGLGERQLRAFWDRGDIREPADIFRVADDEQWLQALSDEKGWGPTSVHNLRAAIHGARDVALERFLFALGIRHVGQGNAAQLARAAESLGRLMALAECARDPETPEYAELAGVDGIGTAQIRALVEHFTDPSTRAVVDNLRAAGVNVQDAEAPAADSPLSGRTLVFTGTLAGLSRNEAKARAEALGARVASAVSAKTDYLVAGEGGGAKRRRAEALNIKVLDEAAFQELLEA
ncbi:MAG: NAD-dependent DNA ligase LigA [Rhodospirillales bacterium]|nr:NAD-dependent DNA ligase LigA [Rhodospirillales bacterium]